jgi:hypothetical protein
MQKARPPHPATVVQPKPAFGMPTVPSPSPAAVAQPSLHLGVRDRFVLDGRRVQVANRWTYPDGDYYALIEVDSDRTYTLSEAEIREDQSTLRVDPTLPLARREQIADELRQLQTASTTWEVPALPVHTPSKDPYNGL